MTEDLLAAALNCIRAGLSIIPIDQTTKCPAMQVLPKDENRKPIWKPYQQQPPDEATVRQWFQSGVRAFAIVGGSVSAGLLVFDFDSARFYGAWRANVGTSADGLPVQQTGGGGYQVFLRCPSPGGNDKLAWEPNEAKESGRSIAIETRGEGGYAIVAPSLHPSGNRYKMIVGDLANIPTIPQAQADALLAAARKLDEAPFTRQEQERLEKEAHEEHRNQRAGSNGQTSVIHAFNAAHSVEAMLSENGYVKGSHDRYIRPGGKSKSVWVKDGRSCHFSTNDPLNDGKVRSGLGVHDAFDLFAHFAHCGDTTAAVKAAAELLGISQTGGVEDEPFSQAHVWPEPLPKEAFHGLAGQIVRAIEPHTEADPVALLVQLLAAYGSMIGRKSYFEADGARHFANLFAVLVGDTAKGRKGTSWQQASRLCKDARPDWLEQRVVEGLASGEGLIWAVRDRITKREPIKEKGRVVEYQEVEVDPGISDKRLLVFESEYAQCLKVVQRDGNTLSPIIRRAWDNGTLRTLTKNSPAVATDAHISIVGHITREELVRLLDATETANGFANRFLWFCVRRSKCLPEGGNINSVDFSDMTKALIKAIDFGEEGHLMMRDQEAREIWKAIYPELSEGRPGLYGAVTTRAEAQVMRLAIIYALLDLSPWIKPEHLKAALAVWEYVEASARYIFGGSLGDRVADDILSALKSKPTGMTRTEIRDLFKGHRESAKITQALGVLLRHNLARFETTETGGRPVERWFAVSSSAQKAH